MTIKKPIDIERVKELLRNSIPDMQIKKGYKQQKTDGAIADSLVDLVGTGLTGHKRAGHVLRFRNALKTCAPAYIEARMGAKDDAEELKLKLEFAQRVVEEYLERLNDFESSKVAHDGQRRIFKNEDRKGTQFQPFRFSSLVQNWMNPENLVEEPATA